ncbi:hypothetical protein AB0N05_07715 [Nocardia sp. NPDC051030]|uniref:hypothetical protein n=1 Tax=Nocardia sp. NPDC051030 TaxID=3155162 RepID=UPI00344831E1
MSKRFLVGLPVAVFAVVPLFGMAGMATAHADTVNFTCTGQTWAGEELPAVTVEIHVKRNTRDTSLARQAAQKAQPEWRGTAKFSTINCQKQG